MDERASLSRRRLLAGGAAVAGAAGAAGWLGSERARPPESATFGSDVVPFHGVHQAGVETPAQAHGSFIGLNLLPGGEVLDRLQAVLKLWTTDAERMTQGLPALADTEPELALRPSRLTVTVGFGPTLFDKAGLVRYRPPSARPLPVLPVDRLQPRWAGTDLLLQICTDDPMVLAHTTRVLVKNVRTLAVEKWRQNGFRGARGADRDEVTPRNLMGQVDGTVNPVAGTPDLDAVVWDGSDPQPWMAGGTLMVLRRIRMDLDGWDALDRGSRELVVGRTLATGAPLSGERETDPVDVTAQRGGIPIIPPNAHIALAHPRNSGERFLRRVYNYDDPPGPGEISDSGLIFVTYQRDIDLQFLPVQRRLAESDAMNRWTTPVGSAVYVIPPGVRPGENLGRQLFDAAASAG